MTTEQAEREIDELEDKLTQIPPDYDICHQHIEAQMMRDFDEIKDKNLTECICCGEVYDAPLYKICDPPKAFANFGFGITLYYTMMKTAFKILSTILIPATIACVFMLFNGLTNGEETKYNSTSGQNYTYQHDKVGGENSDDSFLNYISPANYYYNNFQGFMLIFCFAYIITYYCMWLRGIRAIRDLDTKLDSENLTPSDYAIQLTGLPQDDLDEDDFLFRICNHSPHDPKVIRSVFVYDIKHYIQITSQLTKLKKNRQLILSYRNAYRRMMKKKGKPLTEDELQTIYPPGENLCLCCWKKSVEDLDYLKGKIKHLETVLEEYEEREDLKRGETAYVTFKWSTVSDDMVDKFEVTDLEKYLGRTKLKYRGHNIYLKRAPEPEDIIWENLAYNFMDKARRVILTWLITLVILCICFAINLLITQEIRTRRDEAEENDESYATVNGLSFLGAMTTVMLNRMLSIFITKFTKLEKHHTTTEYQISTAFKLGIAMFINSALIPLFINNEKDEYFSNGGLLWFIVMNWLSLNFLQPVFEYFSPFYFLYLIRKWRTFRQRKSSKLTQTEANIRVQPPQINMPKKYAELINVMLYTGFYLPIFPAGILFTLAGIPFNYIVDKWLMLRRYRQSVRISGKIALFSIFFISSFNLLLAVFSLVIMIMFNNEDESSLSGTIFLGLLPIIFMATIYPIKMYLRWAKKQDKLKKCGNVMHQWLVQEGENKEEFENRFRNIPYDIVNMGKKDYMYYNPTTRPKALVECFEKELEESGGTELEKQQLANYRNQIQAYGSNYMHMMQMMRGHGVGLSGQMMNSTPGAPMQHIYGAGPTTMQPYSQYGQNPGMFGMIANTTHHLYCESRDMTQSLLQKYRGERPPPAPQMLPAPTEGAPRTVSPSQVVPIVIQPPLPYPPQSQAPEPKPRGEYPGAQGTQYAGGQGVPVYGQGPPMQGVYGANPLPPPPYPQPRPQYPYPVVYQNPPPTILPYPAPQGVPYPTPPQYPSPAYPNVYPPPYSNPPPQ